VIDGVMNGRSGSGVFREVYFQGSVFFVVRPEKEALDARVGVDMGLRCIGYGKK
jgi:hypothetical protein